VLKLACVNCGAPLEIGPDLDSFACGYCGSRQQVERKGGTVALRKVENAINAVQRGTDRTAAELAMPRLRAELAERQAARGSALTLAQARTDSARRGRRMLTLITFVVMLFLGSALLGAVGPTSASVSAILRVCWAVAVLGVPAFVYRKIKLPPDTAASIAARFDDEIRKITLHLDANRAILDRLPI
jgi:DNA-directed RNA polymerase subunit RPC12/RpoP